MPYKKPSLWDWVKLFPKVLYWRFIWKPKREGELEKKNIKVIGVGNGGCNVIKQLLKSPGLGCQYIVCNTDIRSLDSVPMVDPTVGDILSVQIGEHLTRGFGAGGDSRVGERAADEGRFLLKRALKNWSAPSTKERDKGVDLVFITAGLGGGTGTGAAPVVAMTAKEACPKALVIGVVSMPFAFEGKKRFQLALAGLGKLRPSVENLVVIDNDRLLEYTDARTPTQNAFHVADEAVANLINMVVNAVNVPGELNVDLQDVGMVMSCPGGALMAIGKADSHSPHPAVEAAEMAIGNRLLDIEMSAAQAVLFNFDGGPDLSLGEVNDAANLIAREVDPSAIMFFGMSKPREELRGSVHVTLLATGIDPELPQAWLVK